MKRARHVTVAAARGGRGHVVVLLMTILAALCAAALILTGRMDREIDSRAARDLRVQALWLARSAIDSGAKGEQEVVTPLGTATVSVERKGDAATAEVGLAGARAVISTSPWTERFDAPVDGAAAAVAGDENPGLDPTAPANRTP